MSPSEHEKIVRQEPQHGLPLIASPHRNNVFGCFSVVVVISWLLLALVSQVLFVRSQLVIQIMF